MRVIVCCFYAIFMHLVGCASLNKPPPIDFSLATASKSDVTFKLYKNLTQKEGIVITEDNIKSEIDPKLPTKIFIHGYSQSANTSPWYNLLKDKYFNEEAHNIIYVDWSKAGNSSIEKAAANIKPAGEFIADLLIASLLKPDKIHLIGFSLAGHMPGFAGKYYYKKTGKKLGRITSFDPAGHSFEYAEPEARLSDQDAEFVDVIHTDINNFGLIRPVGHVDFYPNGGKNQPGCPPHTVDVYCNHGRAIVYFVESIGNPKAKAQKIKFDIANEKFTLEGGNEIIFGDSTPKSARGVYFIETNSDVPFLK